jgi:hypothetical protein
MRTHPAVHRSTSVAGVVAWLVAASACACSSGPTTGPAASMDAAAEGSSVTSSSGGGSGSSSGVLGIDAGLETCAAMATRAACESCCENEHKAGYGTYYAALLQCACDVLAACAAPCATTACASLSIAPPVGSTCDVCLNQVQDSAAGGQCVLPIASACSAVPDCQNGLLACVNPCLMKP